VIIGGGLTAGIDRSARRKRDTTMPRALYLYTALRTGRRRCLHHYFLPDCACFPSSVLLNAGDDPCLFKNSDKDSAIVLLLTGRLVVEDSRALRDLLLSSMASRPISFAKGACAASSSCCAFICAYSIRSGHLWREIACQVLKSMTRSPLPDKSSDCRSLETPISRGN
jgi:hypothetical protein